MAKWLEPNLTQLPFLPNEGRVTGEEKSLTPVISFLASILARVSLGAAVFFFSFRFRFVLFELTIPEIYSDYTNGLVFIADIFICSTLLFLDDRPDFPAAQTFPGAIGDFNSPAWSPGIKPGKCLWVECLANFLISLLEDADTIHFLSLFVEWIS